MKEYTDQEFATIVDECVAEVEEMMKPKKSEPIPERVLWVQRFVAVMLG